MRRALRSAAAWGLWSSLPGQQHIEPKPEQVVLNPLAVAKWASAVMASLWVRVPAASQALLLLMLIDFSTGLIVAAIRGNLDSHRSWVGLLKKVLVLLVVATATVVGRSAGFEFDLAAAVAIAFSVSEAISIVENCANAGVPIPPVLVQALLKAKTLAGTPEPPTKEEK